jgi:hypothetical protein
MNSYYIDGLYLPDKASKKTGIEPYAKVIWANSQQEALRMAMAELGGGQWMEGPTIRTSEEQRMRSMGAPELPGLGTTKKPKP